MSVCPRCGEYAGTRWTNLGPLLLCVALWAIPLAFLLLHTYPFGVLAMTVATVWAARRVRRVCGHCGADRSGRAAGSARRHTQVR